MSSLDPFLQLVWREIGTQLRGRAFVVLTSLAALLTLVVVAVGVREFEFRQREFIRLTDERLAAQRMPPGLLMGRSSEAALDVVLAPEPLRILVRGAGPMRPQVVSFSPSGVKITEPPSVAGLDETTPIDMEFVIRVILGLLAAWLAIEAIAKERATGTLLALLTQPVSPVAILTSKLLGATMVCSLSLFTVLVMAAFTFVLLGHGSLAMVLALPLAVVFIHGSIYLFAMLAAGLLLSVIWRSEGASTAATLATWLVLSVIAIPIMPLVVSALFPVPSAAIIASEREATYQTRLRSLQDSLGLAFAHAASTRAEWAQAEQSETVRAKLDQMWKAGIESIRNDFANADREWHNAAVRHRRMNSIASALTPGTGFRDACSQLAGTGIAASDRWENSLQSYQALLEGRLFDDPPVITLRIPIDQGTAIESLGRHPPDKAASFPTFLPAPADYWQYARDSMGSAILVGFLGVVYATSGSIIGIARRRLLP